MSDFLDNLNGAHMEQRDALTFALSAMHRTQTKLVELLARMESRLDALEARGETSKDEFASWMTDNIGEVAASLTSIDSFTDHIREIADDAADESFRNNIRNVSVSVDNFDISLDV